LKIQSVKVQAEKVKMLTDVWTLGKNLWMAGFYL